MDETMHSTGLTEAEWGVVERLAECHSLMSEISDLDFARFDTGIQALQEQVLSLPAKRACRRSHCAAGDCSEKKVLP
jgi:hypothetical protein